MQSLAIAVEVIVFFIPMGHISETLQASVQSMSTALAAGQGTQQQTMEQRPVSYTHLDVYKRQIWTTGCVPTASGCTTV